MERLRTAILGLNDAGLCLLKAAWQVDFFEVVAVGDEDGQVAEQTGRQYNCAAYDDFRQLVIQNEFDCLLVAAGLHCCDEHVKAAIKRKFNILKVGPPARNFEEAVEFVRLAESEHVKFAVGNPSRFSPSFVAFRRFIQEQGLDHVLLLTAMCGVSGGFRPSWQNDPKLAGGGVLLHDCYGLIDQIVWNFGVPQQVYAACSSAAGDRQQRQYVTEDTVILTMKFSDTLAGSLTGSRCLDFGRQRQGLRVYGKERVAAAGDQEFLVTDGLGAVCSRSESENDPVLCSRRLLENFGASILSPAEIRLLSSGRENLGNMAVIESAYLSSRTGFPEEPGKVLQMARLESSGM
jgi:predicted dehydrogenase